MNAMKSRAFGFVKCAPAARVARSALDPNKCQTGSVCQTGSDLTRFSQFFLRRAMHFRPIAFEDEIQEPDNETVRQEYEERRNRGVMPQVA